MKSYLVMIGHTNATWLVTATKIYFDRISKYIPFETIYIKEIKKGKKIPEKDIKIKEGEEILKNISKGDFVVLLDVKGKELGSKDFASFMELQMIKGLRRLVFVIGGAYGFSEQIYNRADFLLSLSKMTFSHQMVRLIFAEQLYRALSIINNDPYHHE